MKVKEAVAKHQEQLIYIALGVYVAGVLWFTLVDREPLYEIRVFSPFLSYKKIFQGNVTPIKENLANIILFIPTGYFIRTFLKQCCKRTVIYGFIISLTIELVQLISTLGCFEFDDLLHNSIGTLIGWYMWKLLPEEALVSKIEQFLALDNEKRKFMGIRGRKHVEDNFSREIVVNAYKEKIKKILGR